MAEGEAMICGLEDIQTVLWQPSPFLLSVEGFPFCLDMERYYIIQSTSV